IDRPPAVRALELYRSLLQYAPPPAIGSDYEDQERRFGAGEIAMILNGPWSIRELERGVAFSGHPERLGVSPLWAGDLSGHGFVVRRCFRDPARAWALAERWAAPAAQAEMAERAGIVPADPSVLVEDPRARAFRAALVRARPRPAHPSMVH